MQDVATAGGQEAKVKTMRKTPPGEGGEGVHGAGTDKVAEVMVKHRDEATDKVGEVMAIAKVKLTLDGANPLRLSPACLTGFSA